ncbi:hypothetical protein [Streptomyces sp. NPDC088775]|uniref:hypothetical protein n=1 Tax=Streptomyces sp. NPDC088775 TaxID=3365896 RepID=UPI00380E007B
MTKTVTAPPTVEQVRALAAFATARVQETIGALKQRVPELADGVKRSADAKLILRVPEALILAISTYEKTLLRQFEWPDGNPDIVRQAWNDMLGSCADWRDHPELPADLREPLSTAQPLQP